MLLEVNHLSKYFPLLKGPFKRKAGDLKAVNDVSFQIGEGETFGLVGESGCGKTTVGKSILRLIEPTAGEVLLDGVDVLKLSRQEMLHRRRDMQIIFQDPYGSLNPRMTAGDIVADPLLKHGIARGAAAQAEVLRLFDIVGLTAEDMRKYPHEFSGGQRQRIAIARALVLRPRLVVCDEPVSALDVSVQAQILNLMNELQKEFKLAYLFIAHGMPAVRHVSRRVAVMYLGSIVEMADAADIFSGCLHPYTRSLMSAIPIPDPTAPRQEVLLEGEVPSLVNPPPGCLFSSRCDSCRALCRERVPEMREIKPGHFVACHFPDGEADAVQN